MLFLAYSDVIKIQNTRLTKLRNLVSPSLVVVAGTCRVGVPLSTLEEDSVVQCSIRFTDAKKIVRSMNNNSFKCFDRHEISQFLNFFVKLNYKKFENKFS